MPLPQVLDAHLGFSNLGQWVIRASSHDPVSMLVGTCTAIKITELIHQWEAQLSDCVY